MRATSTTRPRRCKGIDIVGVDVHIGSQITDLEPFETAFRRVAGLVKHLRADGHSHRPPRSGRRAGRAL